MRKKTEMKHNPKQQWDDLSAGRRAGMMVLSVVQISLAVAAWVDLARRPANKVNGRKGVWAVIIGVNYVGPIGYFLKGRRTD